LHSAVNAVIAASTDHFDKSPDTHSGAYKIMGNDKIVLQMKLSLCFAEGSKKKLANGKSMCPIQHHESQRISDKPGGVY
jgi:hypothetical protein